MMRLRSCIAFCIISKHLGTSSLRNSAFVLDVRAWKGSAKFMNYFFLSIFYKACFFFFFKKKKYPVNTPVTLSLLSYLL